MWVAFANAKLLIFSAKNISLYAIFNDQNFNDKIVSFEQLGAGDCRCRGTDKQSQLIQSIVTRTGPWDVC